MALTKVSTGLISADLASVDLNIDANTLYIDVTNNRVGINNTGPATALDVTGTVTADGLTVLSSSESSLRSADETPFQLVIGNNTASSTSTHGLRIKQLNSGAVHLDAYDGGGESLLLNALTGGNVGIGTTSPSVLLDLESASPIIRLTDSDASGTPECQISGAGGDLILAADRDNEKADSLIVFQVDGTERVRIDPDSDLSVANGNQTANAVSSKIKFGNRGTFSDASVGRAEIAGVSEGSFWYTGTGLAFSTNPGPDVTSTSPIERMRIDSSGNVGIGVSSLVTGSTRRVLQVSTGSDGGQLALADSTTEAANPRIFATNKEDLKLSTANTATGTIQFITGSTPTERMRIDAAGNVLVGTGSVINTGKVCVEFTGASKNGISLKTTTASNGSKFVSFADSAGIEIGYIEENTSTSVNYSTSSDYRLKENVVAISGATERLKQLKPSRFNFIANPDTTVDGFLAHEVQDIVPEAITGTKDAVDADGNPIYQGIDQSKLVPLLVATIQELEARIAQLEGVN